MSRAAVALATLTLALTTLCPRAHAYCRMVTGAGRQPADFSTCAPLASPTDHYLFWSHRCTELSISNTEPPHSFTIPQVQGVFAVAAATWAAVDCGMGLDLSPRFQIAVLSEANACTHAGHNNRGNNVNSIMFIEDEHDWTEARGWSPQAFAVTLAWHVATTGEIVDVDMEINEGRGQWRICDAAGCIDQDGSRCDIVAGCRHFMSSTGSGPVDLQDVVTHELGHYLGMGHTTRDHPDATMFASATFGELQKRDLANDDIAGLCAAYPPGALATTCDPTPSGGLALDCQAHDCGCGVPGAGDRDGRSAWYASIGLAFLLVVRRVRRR